MEIKNEISFEPKIKKLTETPFDHSKDDKFENFMNWVCEKIGSFLASMARKFWKISAKRRN